MTTPALQFEPAQTRDVRVLMAVLLVLAVAFFAAVELRGEPDRTPATPYGFSVSPQGEGAPRTSQVKVTFRFAPREKDGSKLMTLEPPAKGDFVWQGGRMLIFTPAFPGLIRGHEYTVK